MSSILRVILGFQPLPSYNGRRYLPFSNGKYLVGTTDLMTSSNLFLRCYYPTMPSVSSNDYFNHFDKWTSWLPSLQYADGYMRFKFSHGIPLVPRLFRWLIHNPLCPELGNSTLLKTEKPLPVIIFSHGMCVVSINSILL